MFWNERFKIARPKAFDREKALVKAMRLFWRKGYAATSIEDLVETLGLSRSSLYATFTDKRELFLEALRLYSERVLGRLADGLSKAPAPMAGIERLFDELTAGASSESGAMGCFMVNSITELVPYDPDVTTIAAAYNDTFRRLLAATLTEAAAQGSISSQQTPEQLAQYVFNTVQGLRVLIKAGTTREQAQAISAITLRSLQ